MEKYTRTTVEFCRGLKFLSFLLSFRLPKNKIKSLGIGLKRSCYEKVEELLYSDLAREVISSLHVPYRKFILIDALFKTVRQVSGDLCRAQTVRNSFYSVG